MTINRIDDKKIVQMEKTTFEKAELKERQDLQQMLKDNIGVISGDSPDDEILVVAEEFSNWEDSKRRIDLLGIDKGANLVVIELKRTEDGGHMELQAIRYAAMISTLTFDELVSTYSEYLVKSESGKNAEKELLKFLEWNKPKEDQFGQEMKIVLASAGFSKELTTSVIWLNSSGLDIRCVRIQPYENNDKILLDVQTIIPVPEAKDFLGNRDKKKQKERESRSGVREYYDVSVGDAPPEKRLTKRAAMFHLISGVFKRERTLDALDRIEKETKKTRFRKLEGELDIDQVREKIDSKQHDHYFLSQENEIFRVEGKTYVLTKLWGTDTENDVSAIKKEFPNLNIKFERAD